MNLLRRKLKKAAICGLSVTMCITMSSGCALTNIDSGNGSGGTQTIESLGFTDVTRQYDTSALTAQNFNSSVLKAPQTSYENKTVIVYLGGENILDIKDERQSVQEFLDSPDGFAALRNIDREQKTFLNKLNSHGIKYTLKNTYSTIANAVAIEVDTSYVSKIKSLGGVESAVIGRTYLVPQTETGSSSYANIVENNANVNATGIYNSSAVQDAVWGGKGEGAVVAVIDTGLDYTHEAFQTLPANPSMLKSDVAGLLLGTRAYERTGGSVTVDDVYVSNKIPFAFDYADNDPDVYPSYSNHGTHVAGIVGGYNKDGYDDKDGNHVNTPFLGVATEAQLVICKVFTDDLDSESIGGAESENIMAALEDCVNLGVDVINMSLGTTAGFTTTDDGDDEGEKYNEIFENIRSSGISLICAASNDFSSGYGSVYGTNLASNPDSGTVGSPSTYYAALSVASISGQKSSYMAASDGSAIFFEDSSDGNSVRYDFLERMLGDKQSAEFEYVVVGTGLSADYTSNISNLVNGRIALIERGINTFQEKVELAARHNAIGVIVYNNVSGKIRMSLGDVAEKDFRPAVSITMDAGKKLVSLATGAVGKITLDKSYSAGPFMSDFSSWGTTSDLKIKPEITAHGGEITSTVPGGYAEQSGTSMASPNMAGLTALVRNYVEYSHPSLRAPEVTKLTNQLIMSTATTVLDENGEAYSPRKQGAGLANLANIVSSKAYLFTDEESDGALYYAGKDNRPKIELGEDENKKGEYTFSFKVANMDSAPLSFRPQALFMTETLASDNIAVAEQAYMFSDTGTFTVNNSKVETVTVPGNSSVMVTVSLKLTNDEKKYLNDSFKNGMFVEGFIQLISDDKNQCDLNLPFLAFYGDWEAAPMLDYNVFQISEFKQDGQYTDETRPTETVWATQAYMSYYESNYVIPMGSYMYTQDENADEMYTNEEYSAVSRFNEFVSDEGIGNYMTTYNIRCLYAGLLRNARRVDYKLYDAYTGELIKTGNVNRISKAYANGGSASPAFVELKLSPEELGLLENGKYRFDFEFLFNKDSVATAENTFSFNFYVDYEAPILKDARLRYYNYKEGNKEKQRIYLDLDIYDNHYAQSVMLCYLDTSGEIQQMKLATDYVIPVRNAVKNGVSNVSIEVTDIWEEYKNILTVQIDDYALNHSNYILNSFNSGNGSTADETLNKNVVPDTFELADGESEITLNINETHKVALEYEGSADLSNFLWTTSNRRYVDVKNGEIVGVRATRSPQTVWVSNRKGVERAIKVTVLDKVNNISGLDFSFGVIKNDTEALVKANGTVQVNPGEDIQLQVKAEPWYFQMSDVTIEWDSSNPAVAYVDENGLVHTKTRGSATITATVYANGIRYYPYVRLSVKDEFTISNMVLTAYHGDGETIDGQEGVVVIPEGKNIMVIGEDAFKDNKKITKVIIPKTVTEIRKTAFENCTALKGIYFIDDKKVDYDAENFVADSNLMRINEKAFVGCTALEILDLSNVKVITVAREAFKDCINLKEVVKSRAIGTAYDRAFMGCSSLESIDISGLHVAGDNVFSGCTGLLSVTTDKFSAIGRGMFTGLDYYYRKYNYIINDWETIKKHYGACASLKNITICSATVGVNAFTDCTGLESLTFKDKDGSLEMRIGNYAFNGCSSLSNVDFGSSVVKIIGDYAFAGTAIKTLALPVGLEYIGSGAFSGTSFAVANGSGGYTVENESVIKDGELLLYYGNAVNYQIPASVTKIGANAFSGSNVESITIPSRVTEIGEGAFRNSALASVTFEGNLATIPDYAFFGTKLTSVVLPSTVTYIGNYAFSDTLLNEFNYSPTNKASMGSFVFADCKNLTAITLADNISTIGDRTFMGCTALETALLPSLENLGSYTFWNTGALESVIFGNGSVTTGTYTFAANRVEGRKNLTSVTFGSSLKEIGEGVFYNAASITSVNLKGATMIGDGAFYNCKMLSEVIGLDKVTDIGFISFYNCSELKSLNLANAEHIGDSAFMIEDGNSYTSVTMPKVVTIGALAFFGGSESSLILPSTLQSIGGGAFASSEKLTAISVDGGNKIFFAEDGVLYRTIVSGTFGLVAYPAGKEAQADNGIKTYTVKEGTARIEASAFEGVATDSVVKVVLPYSLKAIGDKAFLNSGITTYVFGSYEAPVLESEHNPLLDEYYDSINVNYRGNYYANFADVYINHTQYAIADPVSMTIYYPVNGIGYTSYVYENYFDKIEKTQTVMETDTNTFVVLMNSFPSAETILSWDTEGKSEEEIAELKAKITALAADVRMARTYYGYIERDEAQLALIDASSGERLSEIEKSLRTVKPRFGISVRISRLSASGNFKTSYKVGEVFDMTGLQVIIEYDDYSTELADMSQITLLDPTGPLETLDNLVRLSGYGETLLIRITVTEKNDDKPVITPPTESGCAGGCGSTSSIDGTLILTFTAIGAMILVSSALRRRNRGNK